MLPKKHFYLLVCLVPNVALAHNNQQDDAIKTDDLLEENISPASIVPLTEDCQQAVGWSGFSREHLFSVSNDTFYFNETESKWAEAGDWCVQRGMLQPVLKSVTQLVAVNKQLQLRGFAHKGFWLAASDVGRSPGQFHWSDGTPVDAALWGAGQPDHFGAHLDTCVFFGTSNNGKLRDWRCWYTAKILCQLTASSNSCH